MFQLDPQILLEMIKARMQFRCVLLLMPIIYKTIVLEGATAYFNGYPQAAARKRCGIIIKYGANTFFRGICIVQEACERI
jgi:hypothetical protein